MPIPRADRTIAMLIELPILWLIIVNVAAWPIIHLGVAWLATQMPRRLFRPEQRWYRERRFEFGGRLYETLLGIRRWKKRLPDGAALFKRGFRKKRIQSYQRAYLERFAQETCRGEAVHWVVLSSSVFFFLWNPWWAGLIMVAYALVANGPCIITQRYNRIRLMKMLGHAKDPEHE